MALTDSSKSVCPDAADTENAVAVTPDPSEDATLIGASHAGPRVERAEARQQRDASTAPVTITVNASDITDYKAFVAFLQSAGFSRAFAKRAAVGAYRSAAEPSAEDPQVAHAIRSTFAAIGDALKG